MTKQTNGVIASTFSQDVDGWTIQGDVQSFMWQSTDGNPGGNLQWVDAATGAVSFYNSSEDFLGNDSAFFNGNLSYDVEDTGSDYNGVPDVELTGDGITIVVTLGQAGTDWTHYSVALNAKADWKIGDLSGAKATAAQIKDVLSNLTQMLIRAEYVDGGESGGLDNVVMTAPSASTTKIWLDGSDAWATALDWTGGTAPAAGNKVVVTEGDPHITATVTLNSSFGEGTAATVTLAGGNLNLRGAATLDGTVDGSSRLVTSQTTAASAFTLGGTVTWQNSGATTTTDGLTLGDGSGVATLLNAKGATFTIGDDSGITAVSGRIINSGTLAKAGSTGTSVIGAAITNTGTVQVSSGTLDLAGTLAGKGSLLIGAGATLELGSTVGSASTVTFGAGSTGTTLQLDDAPAFAARVSGFGTGDTMDLRDIGFPAKPLHYTDTSSGGTSSGILAVSDGTHTAHIHMLGAYTLANFRPGADSGTGTAIAYRANA